MLSPKNPKIRRGYLQPENVDTFFKKRLKKHRMYFKSPHWERLATKDKAYVIAQSFVDSKARSYHPDYIPKIIELVKDHPLMFAAGLGKTSTRHFFFGMGAGIETLFSRLGPNVEKFVRRLYHKNQLAVGANLTALGRGIGKNLDYFMRGMGREGLLRFDKTLQQTGKRYLFLRGLGENSKRYTDAINRMR